MWKRYQYARLVAISIATGQVDYFLRPTWDNRFIEAPTDPKTWLFFLFVAVSNLQGGVNVVYGLIIKGFGFNTLQTTLLSFLLGGAMVVSVTVGTVLLKLFPNSRCILAIVGFIPCSISCLLLMFLPWENKSGLLVAFHFIATDLLGFVMIFSLLVVAFSGHKKVIENWFLMEYKRLTVLSSRK